MRTLKKYTEVIWFGRGGQGAITASQLIADAAYNEGYGGVTTAPSFGAERRGAPVASFLRLSSEPIRIFSKVTDPDIIVVLDPTLLPVINLQEQFRSDACVVVNSRQEPEELGLAGFRRVGVADVTTAALENGLTQSGVPILNTPILGAVIKVTGLVSMSGVEKAIMKKFGDTKAATNILAAQMMYEKTRIFEREV